VNPSLHQTHREEKIRKVLSYVGPEMHYPNYDGIMWFLENCWPLLQAKDQEYTMQIIGLWSEQTATELAEKYHNKVKCVGFVDDLGEALSGTTMIVPLNIGSGIRMKILEAAQLNVPVVTTSVGGEGLPLKDGENSYVADEPNLFVDDILNLQDKSLREKFVTNLRKEIATKYSLQALKDSRISLYQ
jgi:glycosyltransferase involved in cell wall biosynthesis